MKDLAGKVAVVTGSASGMGFAFANRFAEEGMSVVLADIEAEPLAMAEAAIKARGARVLAVRTNVLQDGDVEKLADAAFRTFGNVHVVCNNAGVSGTSGKPVWEAPQEDWDWVFGVNFWGVLRGIRAFVPRMIANGEEGHIVNTASVAGLLTAADPYSVSKHAVVCLTEGLYKNFKTLNLKLSASVLCPGWVNTNIADAGRNRPAELGEVTDPASLPAAVQAGLVAMRGMLQNGYQPSEIAQHVLDAIMTDTFFIIPAQEYIQEAIKTRFDQVLKRENPTTGLF
ncbi:SDR family NAD(P)-dependent oxidoreductase [Candidatus Amarobacter glycogenicus]|uniref:SDR family NAD(P)-dependent oxidoreductase n=1 Tax=Candidatus Amarobacter glycogenicus TaxID=3140699 RepID=UPI0031356DA7|nr:SDR family NAD(P)-dependent oxidoreductase [Dehalococcoidia bacterium]MBK8560214.1 SDR family NAD(P)-dependent oxidoreductase [Dehalococcoidia bacterium]MBK9342050.1 SDR family NAD(P)-dependent oxidoreductase [Dehalococcoidia bacterium]